MNYFSKLKIENLKKGLPRVAKRSGGFTLAELVVVMAISSIILTTLIVKQNSWNDQLAVKTQAYELVLVIRQAQIYSLGAREDVGGSGDKFNVGYGVYFDTTNTRYIYFADRDRDQEYDSGEEIETKNFTRGVTILKICGKRPTNGDFRCSDESSSDGYPKKASITFLRPEPKANIVFRDNDGDIISNSGGTGLVPPLKVHLKSSNDKISIITVEANGQISIQ